MAQSIRQRREHAAALASEIDQCVKRPDGAAGGAPGESAAAVARLRSRAVEAIKQLSATIDDLRRADEECREQNEQLAALLVRVREEHERYERLFELAPVAILVTDRAGTIGEASAGAAALFRRKDRRALRGESVFDLIHPFARPEFSAHLQGAALLGSPRTWLTTLLPDRTSERAGVGRAASVTAHPDDAGGRCRIVRWAFQDMTEVVRARARATEAENQTWLRVAESTAELKAENERLRRQIDELRRAR